MADGSKHRYASCRTVERVRRLAECHTCGIALTTPLTHLLMSCACEVFVASNGYHVLYCKRSDGRRHKQGRQWSGLACKGMQSLHIIAQLLAAAISL